jgi:16S rRNA pseudouridine516 synthase
MQIERILHTQGFGTRKECRALVRAGYVRIGGEDVDDPFTDIPTAGLVLEVDGAVWSYHERAYLMLHKPQGFECSQRPQFHPSVFTLLPDPLVRRGVQSVGRLDEDTTGLLLFSDDGQFIHVWSSGKKRIPKVYEVTTKHPVDAALMERLLAGVELHDEIIPVAAAACQQTGEHGLRLTVTEGKYHQVKRMVAAAGNRVEALHRSQVGGLALPADLPAGQWRWLEHADLTLLADFPAQV